jgi:hypothetical protein
MKQRTLTLILLAALLGFPTLSSAEDYAPDLTRIRAGLLTNGPIATSVRRETSVASATPPQRGNRDSVWNGILIGAGIGAAGGYIWARHECGNDAECAAITNPVGILAGAGIGAAIGAVLDAFSW